MFLDVILHNISRQNFISETSKAPVQEIDFFPIDVESNFRAGFIATFRVFSASPGEKRSLNSIGIFHSRLFKLQLRLLL
jgi:hypothetical protein